MNAFLKKCIGLFALSCLVLSDRSLRSERAVGDEARPRTAAVNLADSRSPAGSPPMGWNSWDGYGTTINEEQVKANADWLGRNPSGRPRSSKETEKSPTDSSGYAAHRASTCIDAAVPNRERAPGSRAEAYLRPATVLFVRRPPTSACFEIGLQVLADRAPCCATDPKCR